MPQKNQLRSSQPSPMPKRAKSHNADDFPGVGVTLSSYNRSARIGSARKIGADTTVQTSRFKRFRSKFTKKRIVLFIILLLLLAGAWFGWKIVSNGSKIFGGNVFDILSSQKLKGEDVGRVNILLVGNSVDDPGHAGAELTDSIMVVSVDTKNNSAILLSIPRDLYVDIPGNGHARINEAYIDGKQDSFNEAGYPEGGVGLLEKIVEDNFQIDINYYALINYAAFRDTVNAVGGIDVTIASNDPRGLYDSNIAKVDGGPLKIANGPQHLDGQTALNLARARGDGAVTYGLPRSDFDRSQNQRMMLIALKDKVTTAGVIANPLKLSKLLDALGKNVTTDFNAGEFRRLAEIGGKIPSSQVVSVGLNDVDGKSLLKNYSVNGASLQIPAAGLDDYSEIQAMLTKLMSSNPVEREGASVVVLNGTDTAGLATLKSKQLSDQGMSVDALGDANENTAKTFIIDTSDGKKPNTKKYLEKTYKTTAQTANPYAGAYTTDFIIVIGASDIPAAANL